MGMQALYHRAAVLLAALSVAFALPAFSADKPEGELPIPRFVSLRTNEVNMRVGPGTRYSINWVYKHEGKRMKPELRCHAVLCKKEMEPLQISTSLNRFLQAALQVFPCYKVDIAHAKSHVSRSIGERNWQQRRLGRTLLVGWGRGGSYSCRQAL